MTKEPASITLVGPANEVHHCLVVRGLCITQTPDGFLIVNPCVDVLQSNGKLMSKPLDIRDELRTITYPVMNTAQKLLTGQQVLWFPSEEFKEYNGTPFEYEGQGPPSDKIIEVVGG